MVRIIYSTLILTLILLGPAWASMASIGKENVNVRSAPNLRADVLFQVPFGYPVEIKQTKGSWVQIEDYNDNTGWVHRPLINQKINTALITQDIVNIRKGPGLKYPVVKKAEDGEIYKIFEEKGNWVRIGFYFENEEVGWVRSDLVWGE